MRLTHWFLLLFSWMPSFFVLESLALESGVNEQDDPQISQRSEQPLNKLLVQWQDKMSSVTTVQASFSANSIPATTNGFVQKKFVGRLAALNSTTAATEFRSDSDRDGVEKTRIVWNLPNFFLYESRPGNDGHETFRCIVAKDETLSSQCAFFPFFFQFTIRELQSRFDVSLVEENQSEVKFRLKNKKYVDKWFANNTIGAFPYFVSETFVKEVVVTLDRTSMLPKEHLVTVRDGNQRIYKFDRIILNQPVDNDLFRILP